MATMIFLFILFLSAGKISAAFTAADHYILSCGSSSSPSVSAFDNRTWYPDRNDTFSSSFTSTIAVYANHDPSNPGAPFTAARIFNSSFTYTFPVSRPGPLFLRLYFYPALYSDQFDASQFFVSVDANGHLLLRNFSAQLAINYAPFTRWLNGTPDKYIIKEYHLTVPNNSLKLTFTPTPPSSYAFVNGIEVVSVPEYLYVNDNDVKNVESTVSFGMRSSYALETAYRLNVGGSDLPLQIDGDISGMFRLWKEDDLYMFPFQGQPGETKYPINYTKQVPSYTAPEQVYQSYQQLGNLGQEPDINMKLNLTWRFKVDPGFYYMLRFHWCEVDYHINKGELLIEVCINNDTAETEADIMFGTDNQRYVPVFRDYVVLVTGGDGSSGSGDIWITLRPSAKEHPYNEVRLNGLDIFKINNLTDGSLYSTNPHVSLESKNVTTKPRNQSHLPPAAIIGGTVAGVLFTSLVAWLLILWRIRGKKESTTFGTRTSKSYWLFPFPNSGSKTSDTGSTLPSHLCRRFSLAQIKLATSDFYEALIIGRGGFGNVYKGMVDGEKGPFAVAIKRLNSSSKQGAREFRNEIEMLSKLRHVHLVSLIGYCDESEEMILVYEYMDRGTLRDHLYSPNNPPLPWNQRLNACLGAAKGLQYLHAGASHMIIHRDVKSTNILLDDKWVAKVSDFGLSKLGPSGGDLSHVSTAVKGSFGYVDPEYYRLQRLTEKSDVYSFGVVLFEVLCGRAVVNPSLNKEQVNLAMWARSHQRKGALDVIVDPNIMGEIAPACLRKFGEIAERCVHDHGSNRPSMNDVVWSLEFALDLQLNADTMPYQATVLSSTITAESATAATTTASSTATDDGFMFSNTSGERITRTSSSSALIMSECEDMDNLVPQPVFSEICNPLGR